MRALRGYVRLIDGLSEWLGWLSMMLVVITVIIGIYNVAARYIGYYIGVQLSSNVFIELQWYLYSLVFFTGFSYILRHGINVRVDFIYAGWSKKRKATLDFWGHLFFLVPFCILGIWVTVSPVLASWGLRPNGSWGMWEVSPDPGGLPRAPLKTVIIIAFAFLLLQAMSELIKLLAVMINRQADLVVEAKIEPDTPLRIE